METKPAAAKPPPAASTVLQQFLCESLESTTAHGLSRTLSRKGWFVRCYWVVLFLIFMSIFIMSSVQFVRRLQNPQVATSLQVNFVDFHFPDIFVCFDSPLSGTAYLAASAELRQQVRDTFDAVDAAIARLCPKNVSTNIAICAFNGTTEFLKVNSLPFSTLNQLARQAGDVVLSGALISGSGVNINMSVINATAFHHATFVQCAKMNISDQQQELLRNSGPGSGLYLTLMFDFFDAQLHVKHNGSVFPTVTDAGVTLAAPDWILAPDVAMMSRRIPAAKVFLVPKNEFPSDLSARVLLGPGQHHSVSVSQLDQTRDAEEFPGSCLAEHDDVAFVNPSDNSSVLFKYNEAHCYFSAVQRMMLRYTNSTIGYMPQAAPKAPQPSFTDVVNNPVVETLTLAEVRDIQQAESPMKTCSSRKLCSRRTYSAQVRSVRWPIRADMPQMAAILAGKVGANATQLPALLHAHDLLSNASKADAALEFAGRNFARVHVTPADVKGDLVTFTLSYTLQNFLADVGGIMGMYLGMSLLTFCELLEFLYGFLQLRCQSRTGSSRVQPQAAVT